MVKIKERRKIPGGYAQLTDCRTCMKTGEVNGKKCMDCNGHGVYRLSVDHFAEIFEDTNLEKNGDKN